MVLVADSIAAGVAAYPFNGAILEVTSGDARVTVGHLTSYGLVGRWVVYGVEVQLWSTASLGSRTSDILTWSWLLIGPPSTRILLRRGAAVDKVKAGTPIGAGAELLVYCCHNPGVGVMP